MEAGKFRSNLFFRLNLIEVPMPNLTERRDDIELLVIELHQQTIDLLNRVAAYQNEAARLRQEAATARKRVEA